MQHGGLIVQFWMIVRDNDDFYSVQTFKPIPMPPRKSMVKSGIYQKEVQIELIQGYERGVEHSFLLAYRRHTAIGWLLWEGKGTESETSYISLILNFLWVFDSNLLLLGNGTTCLPNVIYVNDFKIIMYHLEDIKYRYINDDKANHRPIKGIKIEKKNHLSPGNHPLLFGWCFHLHCSGSCHRHASLGCWGYVLQKERQQAYGYFYRG